MPPPTLLAVPNVSEGRDAAAVAAIEAAFAGPGGVRLLDSHSDRDHHRTVFTLAGPPGALADALLEGARAAVEQIDIGDGRGVHPHVGAVDVVPVVYLDDGARGAACAEALVAADRIGEECGVPVFLYGALGAGRTRAELRRGGAARLAERMRLGEMQPDFGPREPHPGAGITLVAAREPLVAFNLQLAAPATVEDARRIAALIREGGGEGLSGLRAIGVELQGPIEDRSAAASAGSPPLDRGAVGQVSMNVERPSELPLARVVQAVCGHAEVASAELVGLAPRAALEGFPDEVQLVGFDPARHVIENALAG
jgi:glutamate formiminotransferase/glutamate formiminotransferase/formiminotetrahydrofolate cyclodeaminase